MASFENSENASLDLSSDLIQFKVKSVIAEKKVPASKGLGAKNSLSPVSTNHLDCLIYSGNSLYFSLSCLYSFSSKPSTSNKILSRLI